MKEEEAEIKLSKMADLLLDLREEHKKLVEHIATKHKQEADRLRAQLLAMGKKLDEVTELVNSQTYIKRLSKKADGLDKQLHDAFQEGFDCGKDHGNIEYKYPPGNIAWKWSKTRQSLDHLPPVVEDYSDFYKNGVTTDIEEEKFN